MKRALVSVTDKTGVVEFCKGLEECGYEIVSTGGTKKVLLAGGVKAIDHLIQQHMVIVLIHHQVLLRIIHIL